MQCAKCTEEWNTDDETIERLTSTPNKRERSNEKQINEANKCLRVLGEMQQLLTTIDTTTPEIIVLVVQYALVLAFYVCVFFFSGKNKSQPSLM